MITYTERHNHYMYCQYERGHRTEERGESGEERIVERREERGEERGERHAPPHDATLHVFGAA